MEINNKKVTKELLLPVINYIHNGNFNDALKLLTQFQKQRFEEDIIFKLKGSIFLKQRKWQESINNYEKYLETNGNKFEGYYNIGVAYFNLGQLSKTIKNFEIALTHNKNIQIYESLGIAYKRVGNYKQSSQYFLLGLNLNSKHHRIIQNLIDNFNYYRPEQSENNILKINKEILSIGSKLTNQKIITKNDILNLLENSNHLLNRYNSELTYFETQIFRKNNINLNCKRHLTIFKKNKVIPKFCFGCFKIQIKLTNVVEVINLLFYFNNLKLKNNNIRKCIVETRSQIKGNYKAYIYCNSINESKEILTQVKKDFEKYKIMFNKIEIKHGCTEYYKEYNSFEKIEENNIDKIYKKDWERIEKKFDEDNFVKEKNKERVFNNTVNQYNLSDFLIIKNWLVYAKITGDLTYKEVFKSDLKINYLENILKNQIEIRKS